MYQQEKGEGQGKGRVATEPTEQGMRRKTGPGLALTDRKKLRNVGKEESDPSENQSNASSTPGSSFIAGEDQEKMMVLSAQARQALIEMQRFDRFIYVMESQKRLKGPIEKELKRLQKIKNSGNKSMKNTYFDNELTITCLFNHMKNMYQMNRDLGEIVVLKAQIQALQQKIIDQNVKYNKDIKEASSAARGKFAEDSQQLKQILKFHENIISALKETNFDRSKKKIEVQIKKATQDRKQLLELISSLVSRASAETSASIIETFTITIDKITQDQGDINKNLAYLEKQRKGIEKLLNDPRTDQAKKKVLQQLLDTILYIVSIYGLAKTSGGGTVTQQQITTPAKNQKQEQTSAADKKLLRDLEAQLKALQQQGNTWVIQFQTLTTRLENDQNIAIDLNKLRKLLGVKKNLDPTISSFTQLILNVLEIFNKKLREQTQSTNAEKDKLIQIQKLTKINVTLEKEVQQLRDEVSKAAKVNQKQPAVNVQAQRIKLLGIVDAAFKKRQENDPQSQGQVTKARKFIQLNRKKFPGQLHGILDTIEYLISVIIQSDQNYKLIDQELQKKDQLNTKQITNLDVFSKGLQKLLTSGDVFNDVFLNKLKKNLQAAFNKLQKQEETPILNMYLGNLDNTWKIIQLLEKAHQLSKSKGDVEVKKQQFDTLRDQLKGKQQDLKTKEQQLKSSRQQYTNLQRKIKDYEKRIEQFEKKDGDKKAQFQQQRKDKQRIQALERELEGLQREKQIIIVQHDKDIKKLTSDAQNSANTRQLERQNNDLRKSIETLNKSINDSKIKDNKEVERLKRDIEQLKSIQNAQQEAGNLKNEEIENLKKKIKDLERTKNEVKYVETKVTESRDQGQSSEYWRERYQASKLENEVLRDQLAALERRFDDIQIMNSSNMHTINIIKPQNSGDIDVNKLKASLANQQALVLSKTLEVEHYQSQQQNYKSTIQNLNQQLRSAQLSIGSSQSASVQQQISQLVNQNAKLQEEIINVKNQLNSTIDNLIFVDGENFKINENFKKAEEKNKLLEQRYASLENSVKSGLHISKLRDEKIELENRYEDLKRQMDILVIQLQSHRDGTAGTKKARGSFKLPGTPKGNKVVSVQWATSSQVFGSESNKNHTKSQSNFNFQPEKGKQVQILLAKVSKLQNQNQALVQRLNLLSVFNNSMTEVNQFFPDNLNRLIQNIIRFMIDFQGLTQDVLVDVDLLSQIQKSLKSQDFVKYFQLSEQYVRNAITTLLINKNKIVQSIETHEIITQNILTREIESYDAVDIGSLQSLFKLYLKAKDPQLLGQIRDIMLLKE